MSEMDWKTIEGFDQYRIYQDGRVYSCRRKIVLKQLIHRDGYRFVILCKNKFRKHKRIHRLVAEHFIPNPENKPIVDHIDRDPTNNMIWNLRWVTPSESNFNTGVQKDNKLGEKYIYVEKDTNRFVVQSHPHKIKKRFKTLEDAIKYRNEIGKELGLVY